MNEDRRFDCEYREPEGAAGKNRRCRSGLKLRTAFIMGAVCAAAVIFGLTFVLRGGFVTASEMKHYRELEDRYGKYDEILRMIGEDPIAEKSPEEMTDARLKELVSSIGDPYAEYYTEEEYEEFQKKFSSDYVGVGIVVAQVKDKVVILSVFEDGPASSAGIEPGDEIVLVDGTRPKDMNDAVARITGEPGTEVTVTVVRDDESIPYRMTRARIDQDSVISEPLEEDRSIGYIRITSFIENTDKNFRSAVRDLKKKGCDRFIIDLRDNGGGLTDTSISIADYLLPEGRIMSERYKDGRETVYNSKPGNADITYVVLVNGNTASASEILSGAIQDNRGGKIIGSRTYGKGVTQLSHKFKDGSAIKITVTEYFRPSGKTVQKVGITPDIEATDEDIISKAIEALKK